MGLSELVLLFAGGILAGMINVMAGGAGFMTFPLLVASGMSEIEANASNFVALVPANIAGVIAYRKQLTNPRLRLGWRLGLAAAGGIAGSLALLWLGEASFRTAIPWLLLGSTVLFAVAPSLRTWLTRHHGFDGARFLWLSFILEFVIYAYGGYFGLGMGFLLLAIYSMFGHDDIHEANALRNATIALVTVIGIAIFAHAGVIRWLPCLVMMAGSIAGGYGMLRFAGSLPPIWIRRLILAWAVVLTGAAFYRYL